MRYRSLIVAFLVVVCLGFLTACSDVPEGSIDTLTYDQIRGTGLANKCPQLSETSRGSIPLNSSDALTIQELCIEPTTYFVKEEPTNKRLAAEFIQGKVLTRQTSSLDQIRGDLIWNDDGSLTFKELDGFDFQAITVKLPGGESVPFLFTVKGLVAQSQPGLTSINTSTDLKGGFRVPSYRGATFLDPKGRGVATGYDNAVALPAQADEDELRNANVKRNEVLEGNMSMSIAKVNSTTGEIAGTFESIQPSDTDLGADEPKEVKVRGLFYARVEPKA